MLEYTIRGTSKNLKPIRFDLVLTNDGFKNEVLDPEPLLFFTAESAVKEAEKLAGNVNEMIRDVAVFDLDKKIVKIFVI